MTFKAVFSVTALRVAGAGALFASTLLLTRLLGSTGAGVFFFGQSVTVLFAMLSRLGVDRAIGKLSAHTSLGPERYFRTNTLRGVIALVGALGVATAFAVSLFQHFLLNSASSTTSWDDLRWFVYAIPCLSISMVTGWALIGLSRAGVGTLAMSALQSILVFVFFVFVALNCPAEQRLQAFSVAYFLSNVVPALAGCIWLQLQLASIDNQASSSAFNDRVRLRAWQKTLPSFSAIGFSNALEQWYLSFILGFFGQTTIVAVFTVANRFVAAVQLIMVSAGGVYAPAYATADSSASLSKITKSACLNTVALGLPLVLGIVVVAKPLLSLFGQNFSTGAAVLWILMAAQAVNLVGSPSAMALVMREGVSAIAKICLIAMAWLVVCGALSARSGSVLLVAVAAAGTVLIQSLGAMLRFRHEYGFLGIPNLRAIARS